MRPLDAEGRCDARNRFAATAQELVLCGHNYGLRGWEGGAHWGHLDGNTRARARDYGCSLRRVRALVGCHRYRHGLGRLLGQGESGQRHCLSLQGGGCAGDSLDHRNVLRLIRGGNSPQDRHRPLAVSSYVPNQDA